MNDSLADNEPRPAGPWVRITTGSRLHFGLLDTVAPFGGLGVMIDRPQTELAVHPAESFCCPDSIRDRILPIAQRVQAMSGHEAHQLPACELVLHQRPSAHAGLGSGTQLAMAAAEALLKFSQVTCELSRIQQIAARGKRSGRWRARLQSRRTCLRMCG